MNKIICLIGAFILLVGCSKSGLEGKYICDGKLLNGLEFKSDGKGYANIRGSETAFEYTIDEDRVVLTGNGQSNVLTIKEGSLVGNKGFGTCFPISNNPLFGKWKLESVQDGQGKNVPPEGDFYVEFWPSKVINREGDKVETTTVLDYAVEDGHVAVTVEEGGEEVTQQFQLLEEDRISVRNPRTEEDMILRRVE